MAITSCCEVNKMTYPWSSNNSGFNMNWGFNTTGLAPLQPDGTFDFAAARRAMPSTYASSSGTYDSYVPLTTGNPYDPMVRMDNPWGARFDTYNANMDRMLNLAEGLSWMPVARLGLDAGSAIFNAWNAFGQAKEARRQNDRSWNALKTSYNNQAKMTRESLEARRNNQLAFGGQTNISADDINDIKYLV